MLSQKQKNLLWFAIFTISFLFFIIRSFYFNEPDTPQLLIGSFPVQPFGLLVAMGILFGVYRGQVWAENHGLNAKIASDGTFYMILLGLIGSHFLDVLWYYPAEFINPLEYSCVIDGNIDCHYVFNFRQSYSSLGGFLTAVIVGVVYFRMKKQKVLPYADMSVYAITSAWLFGRLACFSAHDHPGTISDFFLAVNIRGAMRHDLGLYELLFTFIIFGTMMYLTREKRFTGFVVVLVTTMYAPVRFLLDFLRVSDATYIGLTPAQWLTIPLFCTGLYLLYIKRNEIEKPGA